MEIRLLSGLVASDFEIEGIDYGDYPNFCDAYIRDAIVLDNGNFRQCNESELDELNEDADLVYRCVENHIY